MINLLFSLQIIFLRPNRLHGNLGRLSDQTFHELHLWIRLARGKHFLQFLGVGLGVHRVLHAVAVVEAGVPAPRLSDLLLGGDHGPGGIIR